MITNSTLDTKIFLTADESYNAVNNNATIKNQIASALYFKDIGSRKGLTVAQSDVEYTASSSSVKNVYSAKATTDIRKLVTEGYVRINRSGLDVNVVVDKASL